MAANTASRQLQPSQKLLPRGANPPQNWRIFCHIELISFLISHCFPQNITRLSKGAFPAATQSGILLISFRIRRLRAFSAAPVGVAKLVFMTLVPPK